jgi:hypothetical protein
MQLHPGMKPYNYTAYITTGSISTMRSLFARLAATPGVVPKARGSSSAGDDGDGEPPVSTAGQPTLGRNAWYGSPADYRAFEHVVLPGAGGTGDGGDSTGGSFSIDGTRGVTSKGNNRGGGTVTGAVVGAIAGAALLVGAGAAVAGVLRRRRRCGGVEVVAAPRVAAVAGGGGCTSAGTGGATADVPLTRSCPVLAAGPSG